MIHKMLGPFIVKMCVLLSPTRINEFNNYILGRRAYVSIVYRLVGIF